MKWVIWFLLSFVLINASYADQFYNIWNSTLINVSQEQINKLNTQLKDINTKYWVNLDIVTLWQDNKNCFKEINYIKCLFDNHWITWSYVWTINLWIKETTWKGDVNSFMSSNVNNTREIFSEANLKSFQENNLNYLKSSDYLWAIEWFLKSVENYLNNYCSDYKVMWQKHNINVENCKINYIFEQKTEIDRLENEERARLNAERIALENKKIEQERLELEKQRLEEAKQSAIAAEKFRQLSIKVFYTIVVLIILLLIIKYIIRLIEKRRLYNNFRKIFLDLSEYKKFIQNNKQLLDNDKKEILSELDELLKDVEVYLGNRVLTQDEYNKILNVKEKIEKLEKSKLISENDLKNISEKINKIKSIDL